MAQKSCLDCYRKHISTAMAFEDEAGIGNDYKLHKWLAIGELNAAEKEVYQSFPMLAQMTREHRLSYQLDNVHVPTLSLITLANELDEKKDDEDDSEEPK